jgi:hypothetical protein
VEGIFSEVRLYGVLGSSSPWRCVKLSLMATYHWGRKHLKHRKGGEPCEGLSLP